MNAVNGWLKQLSQDEVQNFVSTERAVYEVASGEEIVVTTEDVLVEKLRNLDSLIQLTDNIQ